MATQAEPVLVQAAATPEQGQVLEPAWGSGLTGSTVKPALVQIEPPINVAAQAEAVQSDRDRIASLMQIGTAQE